MDLRLALVLHTAYLQRLVECMMFCVAYVYISQKNLNLSFLLKLNMRGKNSFHSIAVILVSKLVPWLVPHTKELPVSIISCGFLFNNHVPSYFIWMLLPHFASLIVKNPPPQTLHRIKQAQGICIGEYFQYFCWCFMCTSQIFVQDGTFPPTVLIMYIFTQGNWCCIFDSLWPYLLTVKGFCTDTYCVCSLLWSPSFKKTKIHPQTWHILCFWKWTVRCFFF